jgi:hypothetical protein
MAMRASKDGAWSDWINRIALLATCPFLVFMAIWMTEASYLVCGQGNDPPSSCAVRMEFAGGIVFREKLPSIRSMQVREGISRYGRPSYVLVLNSGAPDEKDLYGIGDRGDGAWGVAARLTSYLEDGKGTNNAPLTESLRKPQYGSGALPIVVALLLSGLTITLVVRDVRRARDRFTARR